MDPKDQPTERDILAEVTDVVAAYVGNNDIKIDDLPNLVSTVHRSLISIGKPEREEVAAREPAVPVRRSINADFTICLEDGRKFKSLKRHLKTKYDLTPEQYRERWNLPKDYPMVAPNYAKARSDLAKQMGLGQGGRGGRKDADTQAAPRSRKKTAEPAAAEA